MDSVRFGRALGFGARAAAKTLVTAVDAATSPNPSARSAAGASAGPKAEENRATSAGARAAEHTPRTTERVRQTGEGLKEGSKRFGEATWKPVVKLSGVLWLEVTGLFFGIFALFAGAGAWKMRGDLRDAGMNHDAHVRFLLTLTMALVFGYFCVSSFVKANRRGKRS